MKEQGIQRGFGQGPGVQVSYEDLCLFQHHEQEGSPRQWLSPNDVSAWEGTGEWWGRYGLGELDGSL